MAHRCVRGSHVPHLWPEPGNEGQGGYPEIVGADELGRGTSSVRYALSGLGQSRKASRREEGPAGEEATGALKSSESKAHTFGGARGLGGREPRKGGLGRGPQGLRRPGSQGQPRPIPCFAFPALWFPNLFGLKFVSNFFFSWCN